MHAILWLSGTAGLLGSLFVLIKARGSLRQTSLGLAWGWALGGMLLWAAVWTADGWGLLGRRMLADQLWYLVANVLVCSLIGVLGARRPTSRVWNWFVLWPLLVILEWPAVVDWNRLFDQPQLQLPVPGCLGYAFVLIMGVGNYAGTRYMFPALLLGAALLMLVAPLSSLLPLHAGAAESLRLPATLTVTVAASWAYALAGRPRFHRSRFDRLWFAFRDCYGLVWAKRLQDRVNETAQKEGWRLRLERDGIVWDDADVSDETRTQQEQQLEQSLRWLLGRFVDSPWIDRQLAAGDD